MYTIFLFWHDEWVKIINDYDRIVTQGIPKYLEFNDMEFKHRIGVAHCTYSASHLIWSSLFNIIKYQVKNKSIKCTCCLN